ncbi:uncharacterized protein [Dysidea avara]|uniref:uncharacterized protein isoform X2 n=1 Tax=Dysidea avara TaxID=196820 RepID=UPI003319F684
MQLVQSFNLQAMMAFSKTFYSMFKCWSGSYRVCQTFSSTTRGSTIPGISLSLRGGQRDNVDNKKTVNERQAGSQSTNKMSKELEFDINRPLKHALKSIFDKGGKMMLTFPTASQSQMKRFAGDISSQLCNTKLTSNWSSNALISDCQDDDKSWDIQVDAVEVWTEFNSIINNIECQLHNANVIVDGVDLIKLVAQESQDQDQDHQDSPQTPEKILTVNSTTGLVYFNDYSDDYSLDKPSVFFQAKYQHSQTSQKTFLLINLETLLPIKYDAVSNTFSANVYPQSIHPGIPINDVNPPVESGPSNGTPDQFSWIPYVVDTDPEPYEFREHGGQPGAILYPANMTISQRVSKGQQLLPNVIPAILANTTQKFTIVEVPYISCPEW